MPFFKMDSKPLDDGLKQMSERAESAILMYAKDQSKALESQMKQKAPWTDRTTMARKSLRGEAEKTDNGVRITLSHGVDYGLWLELANEKRYAIIKPTIELEGNKVLDGYSNLLEKMGVKGVK